MSLEESLIERLDYLIAKGTRILDRNRDRRERSKSVRKPEIDEDHGKFTEWQMQTLTLLVNVLGREGIYTRAFATEVRTSLDESVYRGLGILRAVREDIEGGYLSDVRTLVSAEVFTDFLEMAEHLYDNGYKDPAGSLAGAVLEDGLRRVADNKGVKRKTQEDLSSLNHKLANAGVYSRLAQKQIQVWTEIRNNADHGRFDEYTAQDVGDMIRGITRFLDEHLM